MGVVTVCYKMNAIVCTKLKRSIVRVYIAKVQRNKMGEL